MAKLTFYTESSSRIRSMLYDSDDQTLRVEFVRGGIYEYDNVPSEVYEGLIQAQSLGQVFDTKVKGVYKYRKI